MYDIKKQHRHRVRVHFDGKSWYVKLPHYTMVPGTFQPVVKKLIHKDGVYPDADPKKVLELNPTVEVDVPDRMCDDDGNLSTEKIRKLYEGQKAWDHERVVKDATPPVEEPPPED